MVIKAIKVQLASKVVMGMMVLVDCPVDKDLLASLDGLDSLGRVAQR